MADVAMLVGSGTFKVDRRRALEKLKEFQLHDPHQFLLPWTRCAVASGATWIKLRDTGNRVWLELRFDGRPFTADELRHVYECLLDEGTHETVRNRNLAIGILSVLRLEPKQVTVTSGVGRQRTCLRIESLEREALIAPKDQTSDTVLRAEWGYLTGGPYPEKGEDDRIVSSLVEAYQMRPIPLTISSPYFRRPKEPVRGVAPELRLAFVAGGVRGEVVVPGKTPTSYSVLDLYNFGVLGGHITPIFPGVHVVGRINDDRFALNVSQSDVVRNERLMETMRMVEVKSGELLRQVSGRQGRNLQEAGALIRTPLLHRVWCDWMARGEAAESARPADFSNGFLEHVNLLLMDPPEWKPDHVAQIWKTARATTWLREICARASESQGKFAAVPIPEALRDVPLFLSVAGKSLSLKHLDEQRRRTGLVPFSYEPSAGQSLPYDAVWRTCDEDRVALARFFPNLLQDVTLSVVHREGAPTRGAQPSLLQRVGFLQLLARDGFRHGVLAGEVGLSLTPGEGEAFLYILRKGTLAGCVPIPCGLRFVAAVDDPAGKISDGASAERERRELGDAAFAAARGLYKNLVPEYEMAARAPHASAVRAHLLDYLVLTMGSAPSSAGQAEQDRWIEAVPLFDVEHTEVSWWDYRRLRREYEAGVAFYVVRAPEMAQYLSGKPVLVGVTEAMLSRLLPGSVFERVADKLEVGLLFNPSHKQDRAPQASVAPASGGGPPTAAKTPTQPDAELPASPAPVVAPPARQPEPPRAVKGRLVTGRALPNDPAIVSLTHQLLVELHGRRGMKLLGPTVPALRLGRLFGNTPLLIGKGDPWDVDAAHPSVQAVLGASLPEADKAAYLASLVYTAANRLLSSVTDLDDVKFQQALANYEGEPRDGG